MRGQAAPRELSGTVATRSMGLSVGNYRSLKEATPEEFAKSTACFNQVASPELMAERALNLFEQLKGVNIGNLVDQAEHGLQTATRSHRDGADEETVVCALLHDIGEVMSPINHGEIAAGLLRPYITPQNYWILAHHEIFQAYHYQDAAQLSIRDSREWFRGHPYFAACARFCERWDQPSFDPDYNSLPLTFFEPMVRRIFARNPYWHPDHGAEVINAAKMEIGGAYPMEGRSQPQALPEQRSAL